MELGTFSTDTFSKLKPAKSPGPDNIHPMFLRETAYNIALPLTLIFRKSLDEGVLPEEWKCANITPIHKKGLRSEAENYRPISLTSAVIYLDYKKAFDTVPHKRLVNKLEHLGFAGGLLNWLKAFLINRTI